jgi:hypothetical protein
MTISRNQAQTLVSRPRGPTRKRDRKYSPKKKKYNDRKERKVHQVRPDKIYKRKKSTKETYNDEQ